MKMISSKFPLRYRATTYDMQLEENKSNNEYLLDNLSYLIEQADNNRIERIEVGINPRMEYEIKLYVNDKCIK